MEVDHLRGGVSSPLVHLVNLLQLRLQAVGGEGCKVEREGCKVEGEGGEAEWEGWEVEEEGWKVEGCGGVDVWKSGLIEIEKQMNVYLKQIKKTKQIVIAVFNSLDHDFPGLFGHRGEVIGLPSRLPLPLLDLLQQLNFSFSQLLRQVRQLIFEHLQND